jgi:hypothetical protein
MKHDEPELQERLAVLRAHDVARAPHFEATLRGNARSRRPQAVRRMVGAAAVTGAVMVVGIVLLERAAAPD